MHRFQAVVGFLPLAGLWVLTSTGAAQGVVTGPTLVRDIQQEVGPPGSSDTIFLAASGSKWIFSALAPLTGRELWISDGSPLGTSALAELLPGPDSSNPSNALTMPSGAILVAADGEGVGRELYRVDPLQQTVQLLRDIRPGALGSNPESLVLWNGAAWFFAEDGSNGRQVWRSDGTAAGTAPAFLLNLPSGLTDGDQALVASQGHLFFKTSTKPGTRQVWSLANPGAVPAKLLETNQDPFNDLLYFFDSLGANCLFSWKNAATGIEPWISDGTLAGTQLLADISPGPGHSKPWAMDGFGGKAWFIAQNPVTGYEPYVTDGTSAGTLLLGDLNPGPGNSINYAPPQTLATSAGLYFAANTPGVGLEPWISDGTPAGTRLVSDVLPGPESSSARYFVAFGNKIYFSARRTPVVADWELFRTNGTSAGTTLVADLVPGPVGSLATPLAAVDKVLVLGASKPGLGWEPHYMERGPADKPKLLANIAPDPSNVGSFPGDWSVVEGKAFFSAEDQVTGRELWRSNGTLTGTNRIADVWPGPDGSAPEPLGVLGNTLLFQAADGVNGRELWRTDGTLGGTALVRDIVPGSEGVTAQPGAVLKGVLYLSLALPGQPSRLWRTDGTAAGTFPVLSQSGASVPSDITELRRFADRVWFAAGTLSAGRELWRSDGTPQGTQRVSDIEPGLGSSTPSQLTASEQALFFTAQRTTIGRELYAVDGSGTVTLIADLNPGPGSTQFEGLTAFGSRLFAFTKAGTSPQSAYLADGTAGGLVSLSAALPLPALLGAPAVAGDTLYFWLSLPAGQRQLWATDGSLAGTALIGSPSVGQGVPSLIALGSGSEVLSRVQTTDAGLEPWIANNIPGSLRLAADIALGKPGSNAGFGVRVGSGFLLSADEGDLGNELHRLPLVPLGGWAAEPYGAGCGTATIGSLGEARVGSSFAITLKATPGALASLLGSAQSQFGFLAADCQQLIGAPTFTSSAVTDGQGQASVALAIPALPSLAGLTAYFQWASALTGGPLAGLAQLSNGLEVLVGN